MRLKCHTPKQQRYGTSSTTPTHHRMSLRTAREGAGSSAARHRLGTRRGVEWRRRKRQTRMRQCNRRLPGRRGIIEGRPAGRNQAGEMATNATVTDRIQQRVIWRRDGITVTTWHGNDATTVTSCRRCVTYVKCRCYYHKQECPPIIVEWSAAIQVKYDDNRSAVKSGEQHRIGM